MKRHNETTSRTFCPQSTFIRFDPEIYFVAILRIFDTIEFLLFTHVMKWKGFFASNSKYVVCFKKLFAGKGGLYEFIIMFYDMGD